MKTSQKPRMGDIKHHVLVVDDDDRIRDLLTRFLCDRGFRVSSSCQGKQALALCDFFKFDLIVLDIMMPELDGLQLTKIIRQKNTTPILLLTALGETEDRINGFKSGADDYLPKPFDPEELILRIYAILRRFKPQMRGPEAVEFGPWYFERASQQLTCHGERIKLTGAEAALLSALTFQVGTPVSRQTLSEQAASGAGERAVDVQVTRLRKKLETDPSAPIWLQTVRGSGYKLIGKPILDKRGAT